MGFGLLYGMILIRIRNPEGKIFGNYFGFYVRVIVDISEGYVHKGFGGCPRRVHLLKKGLEMYLANKHLETVGWSLSQRVQRYCHYGIRSQQTILSMALGSLIPF